VNAGNRGQLADFLRSRRARLTPADVGLPGDSEPGRRRTPGLRREEVAELSGVGVTWYTWLEQGRKITASPQVVDALARALRLSADEHRHLRELAGLAVAPPASSDDPQARLQRLVDAAAPNAASVYDQHFDYLAWNEPYRLIRHDPAGLPAGRRNLLWMMFTDADNRARMTTWDRAARTLLSQFRAVAGRHPGDPRFAELTAALTEASPQFRDWWAQYPVRYFRPVRIRIRHPQAGRITLELFQLRLEDDPGLVMVTQVPADPASRDRVAALLAGPSAVSGRRDPAAGAPVLVVVGGLPATGKSTVASALARQAGFAFVRVDRIEQAIVDWAGRGQPLRQPLGPVGYTVAYGVAAEQLGHGVSVVAECVNPLGLTRDAWRDIAAGQGARLVEVELVCTDRAAHRERARTREVDIPGLRLPDWEQITSREYEPWDRSHLVIDTAARTPAEAVAAILAAVPERAGPVSADPG
jgi:predicted kinase/transcriptional regulator with XRE-family HTH domain